MMSEHLDWGSTSAFATEKESKSKHAPVGAGSIVEGLPDNIFVTYIWPRLWISAPRNRETGRRLRYLNQEEQKDNIRGMMTLRSLSRRWRQWVDDCEDYCDIITSYFENYILPEFYSKQFSVDEDYILR